jgi:MFS family permease
MGASTVVTSRVARTERAHSVAATLGVTLLAPAFLMVGLCNGMAGLCAGLAVLGLGAGALSSSLLALLGHVAAPEHHGAAAGWLQLCGDVGGVLGPIVGSLLLTRSSTFAYVGGACILGAFIPVGIWLVLTTEHASTPPRAPRG